MAAWWSVGFEFKPHRSLYDLEFFKINFVIPNRKKLNCNNFIDVFSSQVQIMVGSNSQSNPGTVYQLSDIVIVGYILSYIFILFTITIWKNKHNNGWFWHKIIKSIGSPSDCNLRDILKFKLLSNMLRKNLRCLTQWMQGNLINKCYIILICNMA